MSVPRDEFLSFVGIMTLVVLFCAAVYFVVVGIVVTINGGCS